MRHHYNMRFILPSIGLTLTQHSSNDTWKLDLSISKRCDPGTVPSLVFLDVFIEKFKFTVVLTCPP